MISMKFLDEKSVSSTTVELHYTHPRIQKFKNKISLFFSYKKHKNQSISNTTNALEGKVFSVKVG